MWDPFPQAGSSHSDSNGQTEIPEIILTVGIIITNNIYRELAILLE